MSTPVSVDVNLRSQIYLLNAMAAEKAEEAATGVCEDDTDAISRYSEETEMRHLVANGGTTVDITETQETGVPRLWAVRWGGTAMARATCALWCRIIIAAIGVATGIAVVIVFGPIYHNIHATVWGFASGLFAAGVLHMHILHYKNKLDQWYDASILSSLELLGVIVALGSIVAMGVYIALGTVNHQGYDVRNGYYPGATFSFMTIKWGSLLWWYARHYKHIIQRAHPSLLGQWSHQQSIMGS